jgi:para-nitrobenzyl esterase
MTGIFHTHLIMALLVATAAGCTASGGSKAGDDATPIDSATSPVDTTLDSITDTVTGPEDAASTPDTPSPSDTQSPPESDATPAADTKPPEEDATSLPEAVGSIFEKAQFEVKVTEDIVFGQGLTHSTWNANDGEPMDLLLDVYQPVRDAPPPMPVVVVIHGGGFVGGTHKHAQLSSMAKGFAERGWVAFSIDYRVAKHAGTLPPGYPELDGEEAGIAQAEQWNALYPACRDAKAAIRWIRSKADTYSLATDHITAIGGSAGSFIAVALGVSNEDDCVTEISDEADPTLAGTHLDQSSKIHTIIDHWGGPAILTMLNVINPGDRFDASDPPLSIVHGTEDPIVPFTSAEDLKAAYDASGAPYTFTPLAGDGHGPWAAKVNGKSLAQLAFDFIVKHQKLTAE